MDKILDYSKLLKTADEMDIQVSSRLTLQEIRNKYRQDRDKSFDSQYNEFAEENSGVDFNTDGIDYQIAMQAVDGQDTDLSSYHSNCIKIDDGDQEDLGTDKIQEGQVKRVSSRKERNWIVEQGEEDRNL